MLYDLEERLSVQVNEGESKREDEGEKIMKDERKEGRGILQVKLNCGRRKKEKRKRESPLYIFLLHIN